MVYFFLSAFLGYGHHQRVVAHLDSAQYTVGFQLLEQGITLLDTREGVKWKRA